MRGTTRFCHLTELDQNENKVSFSMMVLDSTLSALHQVRIIGETHTQIHTHIWGMELGLPYIHVL